VSECTTVCVEYFVYAVKQVARTTPITVLLHYGGPNTGVSPFRVYSFAHSDHNDSLTLVTNVPVNPD